MKRILLVDDSKSFLDALSDSLNHKGIKVSVAYSADEALKKINEIQFDLICSDYDMGEKNGLDLLNELRRQDNQVKFIMLTGNDSSKLQDIVESKNALFFDKTNLEFINIIQRELLN